MGNQSVRSIKNNIFYETHRQMHVHQVTLVGLTSLDWQAFVRISH